MLKSFLVVLLMGLAALSYWLSPNLIEKTGLTAPGTIADSARQASGYVNPCQNQHKAWRKAIEIDGVTIKSSPFCEPDNPYDVATFVKGVNNVSMHTLMQTRLAEDFLTKSDDLDGDGDPDVIRIKLEVIELNGFTPDGDYVFPSYDIAPGIQPGLWVFAPKSRGMAEKNYRSKIAHELLRAPSPAIRVEQGDKIYITLENSHYFPHTIHFHGVDHPWRLPSGANNDGDPATGAPAIFPGEARTYEMQPRQAGTMFYHCHVQTDKHLMMGLNGLFVVEENRPNNWVQTFNVGAGHVRHSSVAIKEVFDQEYDLHYQSIDKKLAQIIQQANDPRLTAKEMNRHYNMTESDENYFLLNGHSFPYTLRDAMVVVKPNQDIKLRIANAQSSSMAVHFHGHKAKVTHYDGVELSQPAQITRDVFDIAAAQRIDLHLQTVDDGLHSFGSGIWLFHDHVETGITTDGMAPGGNISILVYQDLLDEYGLPKIREEPVNQYFNTEYYARKNPTWNMGDFKQSLGDAGLLAVDYSRLIAFGLALGLALALFLILVSGKLQQRKIK
jgi:hypothetical protein